MEILINNKPVKAGEATTLAEILDREGLVAAGTAVAVDNKVVGRDRWKETVLRDGMRLTVIRAVCGG